MYFLFFQKIFDKFTLRLVDTNSKVNLLALQTLRDMVPIIGKGLDHVVGSAMPPLTSSMASKNKEIVSTARDTLDLMMSCLGKYAPVPMKLCCIQFVRMCHFNWQLFSRTNLNFNFKLI